MTFHQCKGPVLAAGLKSGNISPLRAAGEEKSNWFVYVPTAPSNHCPEGFASKCDSIGLSRGRGCRAVRLDLAAGERIGLEALLREIDIPRCHGSVRVNGRSYFPHLRKSLGGGLFADCNSAEVVVLRDNDVYVSGSLLGGKGGFGTLLRGKGARGPRTSNFESSRDLEGRRIRNSKGPERIREWIKKKKREIKIIKKIGGLDRYVGKKMSSASLMKTYDLQITEGVYNPFLEDPDTHHFKRHTSIDPQLVNKSVQSSLLSESCPPDDAEPGVESSTEPVAITSIVAGDSRVSGGPSQNPLPTQFPTSPPRRPRATGSCGPSSNDERMIPLDVSLLDF